MPIWGKQLPEASSDARQFAGNNAAFVSAHIDAGFTREEAVHIVTTILTAQIIKEH